MSERLGNIALGGQREQVFLGEEIAQRREYSETTAREIDEEVKSILDESYARALNTLKENHRGLDRIAEALLDKEEILGDEVLNLLGVGRDEESSSFLDGRKVEGAG